MILSFKTALLIISVSIFINQCNVDAKLNPSLDSWFTKLDLKYVKCVNTEDLKVVKFLDIGRFSQVFMGKYNSRLDNYCIKVVIKVLKPIEIVRIEKEIRIIDKLSGNANIIQLLGVHFNQNSQCYSLIFEYLGEDVTWLKEFSNDNFSNQEIRLFMFKLLKAVETCHKNGIMHRDIKPRNILINRKKTQLKLIDFGLSEFISKSCQEYNPNVGSKHYKSPELLLEYKYYDNSIDIWAVGVIFASLIFKIDCIFSGNTANEQLHSIVHLLGYSDFLSWINRENIQISPLLKLQLKPFDNDSRVTWLKFRNEINKRRCTALSIDLISKMLVIDPLKRLTATQCLNHPYFDKVRGQLAFE